MKTIAVGPMRRLKAARIAKKKKNMLEFGQFRFQISSYFGNKQTGRSLFAMSVGMGWRRGIARWGLKLKVWPSKCLCAECAGLPAGPAGRRAGITAAPS